MNPGPWQHPPRRPRRASRLGQALWLGALAAIAVMLWALNEYFPRQGDGFNDVQLFRLVAILAVSSSGLLFIRDINLKRTARNILMWLGVAGVLVLGFSYRDELGGIATRVQSQLVPNRPIESTAHDMIIGESDNGDYKVYGEINGKRVLFLVDTGASDIVLSPYDAQRLGIDLKSLKFDHAYESANGIGHGASYRVASLKVGSFLLTDVAVSIDQENMSTSLLGMAFLKRLKEFGFAHRQLFLQW